MITAIQYFLYFLIAVISLISVIQVLYLGGLVHSLGFDIPYVKTNKKLYAEIAKTINLQPKENFIDLGSGMGSLCFYLIKKQPQAKISSVELNFVLVSFQKVINLFYKNKVKIFHDNIEKIDITNYQKIYLYWQPQAIDKYLPKLYKQAKKGTIFYSYYFDFGKNFKGAKQVKLSNNQKLYILKK